VIAGNSTRNWRYRPTPGSPAAEIPATNLPFAILAALCVFQLEWIGSRLHSCCLQIVRAHEGQISATSTAAHVYGAIASWVECAIFRFVFSPQVESKLAGFCDAVRTFDTSPIRRYVWFHRSSLSFVREVCHDDP
jgi:hypothetical protein